MRSPRLTGCAERIPFLLSLANSWAITTVMESYISKKMTNGSHALDMITQAGNAAQEMSETSSREGLRIIRVGGIHEYLFVETESD